MSMTTKDRRKRSAVITGAGSGLGRDIALASQRRVYAASSSGVIGVYQEDDPDHFRKLEDFPVQPMVHSLAVDTATHRVYAPEQQEDGRPVARMVIYEPVQSAPGKR